MPLVMGGAYEASALTMLAGRWLSAGGKYRSLIRCAAAIDTTVHKPLSGTGPPSEPHRKRDDSDEPASCHRYRASSMP